MILWVTAGVPVYLQSDSKDEGILRQAIDNTLSTKLAANFVVETKIPGTDDLKYEGALLQDPKGLFIEYCGTGGKEVHAIRSRSSGIVRVFHEPLVGLVEPNEVWIDARQPGYTDVARGIQSPDDLFTRVKDLSTKFTMARNTDAMHLTLSGKNIFPVIEEIVNENDIDWNSSTASCEMKLDKQDRVVAMSIDGALTSNVADFKGKKVAVSVKLIFKFVDDKENFVFRTFGKVRKVITPPSDFP